MLPTVVGFPSSPPQPGCDVGGDVGAASPRRGLLLPMAALGLWALAGCASRGAGVVDAVIGQKLTRLGGVVQASTDVNPDLRRRPSPILLRLYELKAAAVFSNLDFMSLFQRDQAELGADVVAREEFILQPGESRKLDRTVDAQARFVGVFAAYRDLDRARWRALAPLKVGASQTWEIKADALGVSINPAR